jgi:hypothetical protein
LLLAIELTALTPFLLRPEARRQPPLEGMVEALRRGRLVIEEARFVPGDDRLVNEAEPALRQAARALSHSEGRYWVFVAVEEDERFPADTVLRRRRVQVAFERLIAAGASSARLVEPRLGIPRLPLTPVQAGGARVELVRPAPSD